MVFVVSFKMIYSVLSFLEGFRVLAQHKGLKDSFKTSIIGEDPTKFWDRDPVTCKLNIIKPDLIIKTKDIQFNNWEQEECRMHI